MSTFRPILFSGPMVRAILGGAKTQTRRIASPEYFDLGAGQEFGAACPYGLVGDYLWVRETWGLLDGAYRPVRDRGPNPLFSHVVYRADHQCPDGDGPDRMFWRPSIHMPWWACRICLEITKIRLQRLQEISDEDALAEGIRKFSREAPPEPAGQMVDYYNIENHFPTSSPTARIAFKWLWTRINGVDEKGWGMNPWVWVISFKNIPARGLR